VLEPTAITKKGFQMPQHSLRLLRFHVLVMRLFALFSCSLSMVAAAQEYYMYGGRKVPLQQVDSVLATRILSNAVVAKTQQDYKKNFEVFPSVGLRRDELAISNGNNSLGAAAASINHIEKIQEGQRLRVFTTEGGTALLIEFPEIVIQYAEGTSDAAAQKHIRLYSNNFRKTAVPGRYLVELETASSTIDVANAMSRRNTTPPLVDYAEPNFRIVASMSIPSPAGECVPQTHPPGNAFPNDPFFEDQWGLRSKPRSDGKPSGDVRVSGAWAITHGKSNIKVAVVDEGVDLSHPEIKNKIVASWDAVMRQSGAQAQDDADHGTACAGIIAAESDNRLGMAGVAPNVGIIAIRVAVTDSQGRWITDPATIAAGIDKAVSLGADVINASWGSDPTSPMADVERAIQRAYTNGRKGKGTIVVVAAGNTVFAKGSTATLGGPVSFPASLALGQPVIAVGALSPCEELKTGASCDGQTDWASNYGKEVTVLAPGVGLVTLTNQEKSNPPYSNCFRGTSGAAPFVSGAVALLLSVSPDLTAVEVKKKLVDTGDVLGKLGYGYRRLNICRLVGGVNCAQEVASSATQ
jgi:Subtilase family